MESDRKPRWAVWKLAPRVELWQAVSLSLDLEPTSVWRRTFSAMGEPTPFSHSESQVFTDRLEVACLNASRLTGRSPSGDFTVHLETPTNEFARFAIEVGWEIPEALAQLAPVNWDFWLAQETWTLTSYSCSYGFWSTRYRRMVKWITGLSASFARHCTLTKDYPRLLPKSGSGCLRTTTKTVSLPFQSEGRFDRRRDGKQDVNWAPPESPRSPLPFGSVAAACTPRALARESGLPPLGMGTSMGR